MLWRIATGLIVLFWAVMTVLLVRHHYFPPEAEYSVVPVHLVLERYAANPSPSNTLTLRKDGQNCGNMTMALLDWKEPGTAQHKGFTWQAGGLVDVNSQSSPEARITWSFSGDFTQDERWERIALGARSSLTDTFVNVQWRLGQELPTIEVRKGDKIVMDTKAAMEQAKTNPMMAGMGGLTSMLPSFLGNKAVSLERLIHLGAKEASVRLGGRPRKAFVLTVSLMSLYQTKCWFTEAGELIKVDLPQGFRLVNPLVFGLDDAK